MSQFEKADYSMSQLELAEIQVNPEKYSEYLGFKNASFHKQIYRKLADPNVKRLIVILPPGHGKSTIATVNYVSWEIGNNPDIRVRRKLPRLKQD